MEFKLNETRTRVATRERVITPSRIREAGLSSLEEKVLRMRAGIGLEPSAELEQHAVANPETMRRIEAIEREAVIKLGSGHDARRKQSIIDQLCEL